MAKAQSTTRPFFIDCSLPPVPSLPCKLSPSSLVSYMDISLPLEYSGAQMAESEWHLMFTPYER